MLPPPPQDDSRRRLSAKIGRNTRDFLLPGLTKNRMVSVNSNTIAIGIAGSIRRCRVGLAIGKSEVRAIVDTLTVKGTGVAPEICAELGDALHPPAGGAFVHPSVTVPVKPFTGLNSRAMVAVCPAVTVAEVVPPAGGPIWKSVAVPVSVTGGFAFALSLSVSVAVRVPAASGRNSMSSVQFAPTATLIFAPFAPTQLPEAWKSPASAPAKLTPLMTNAPVPLLLT